MAGGNSAGNSNQRDFFQARLVVLTPGAVVLTPGAVVLTPGAVVLTPGAVVLTPGAAIAGFEPLLEDCFAIIYCKFSLLLRLNTELEDIFIGDCQCLRRSYISATSQSR